MINTVSEIFPIQGRLQKSGDKMKSSQDYYEEAKDEVIALFRKHSGNEFNLINAITNVIAKCDRKIDELEKENSYLRSEV